MGLEDMQDADFVLLLAVVVGGTCAVVYKVVCWTGRKIWNSIFSSTEERKQPEERKRPMTMTAKEMKYELDPSQDITCLTCPITMAIIEEPASTIYGHLFELSAIRDWVRQRGVCPVTRQPLREDQICPQYGLKDSIAQMRRINKENDDLKRQIKKLEASAAQ